VTTRSPAHSAKRRTGKPLSSKVVVASPEMSRLKESGGKEVLTGVSAKALNDFKPSGIHPVK
jgi:hypothetical protein